MKKRLQMNFKKTHKQRLYSDCKRVVHLGFSSFEGQFEHCSHGPFETQNKNKKESAFKGGTPYTWKNGHVFEGECKTAFFMEKVLKLLV